MDNNQQTLQQERAASAWAQVEQVETHPAQFRKEYGSLMRGLPAMILSDGLAQTLAFLQAKGKGDRAKPHSEAYRHLSNWVCQRLNADRNVDLLQWCLTKSSADYRRAATESLAYLHWLKRFVEAKGWQDEKA